MCHVMSVEERAVYGFHLPGNISEIIDVMILTNWNAVKNVKGLVSRKYVMSVGMHTKMMKIIINNWLVQ